MHKKLEAELVSLAHSILEMKNNNVSVLHKKAQEIYEKLSVLKFVGDSINTTATSFDNTDEIIDKATPIIVDNEPGASSNSPEIIEENIITQVLSTKQTEELFNVKDSMVKDDENEIHSIQNTLEDELKDAISADVATDLFERVTKEHPEIEEIPKQTQRSLNDTVYNNNLQVGLNDRIAFVKYLFEGNQEDFNRVLSQLNSFKTEKEAKNFISKMVKPDYDWSDNEEYEQRFVNLIERKFL